MDGEGPPQTAQKKYASTTATITDYARTAPVFAVGHGRGNFATRLRASRSARTVLATRASVSARRIGGERRAIAGHASTERGVRPRLRSMRHSRVANAILGGVGLHATPPSTAYREHARMADTARAMRIAFARTGLQAQTASRSSARTSAAATASAMRPSLGVTVPQGMTDLCVK